MPGIKDAAAIAEKWTRVVQTRQQDYVDGINNPRTDWKSATLAAEGAHTAGVQAAIANKSFAKGVSRAGTATWQQNAAAKGPARWAEGVALSGSNYANGFAPYASVIKSTQLPPRGPAGSPANYQRSQLMGDALHKAKLSRA